MQYFLFDPLNGDSVCLHLINTTGHIFNYFLALKAERASETFYLKLKYEDVECFVYVLDNQNVTNIYARF
jgi:hypothetical protein